MESVNSGIDRGETPLSIFIDIRKAFDTVDFQTLLSRIESLGVHGKCLKWFESYLTGRSLKVVLSDINSAAFPVMSGVDHKVQSWVRFFTLSMLISCVFT